MDDEEIEHEYTDEIVCPYCGYKFEDSYEFELDTRKSNLNCDECGEEFFAYEEVSYSYLTIKKPKVKS